LKIGILTIATGRYLEYWNEMVASALVNLNNSDYEITFHVFTERYNEAQNFSQNFKPFEFKVHRIPGYGWPEATLLRYEIINEFKDQYDEDVLMHLDADMLIQGNFLESIKWDELIGGIGLVAHPGFWRPRHEKRIKLYLRYPRILFSDIRSLLMYGGLGTWETRKQSHAFVKRRDRRHYVCGGSWLGTRSKFLEMIGTCAESVQRDIVQDQIAAWHDESHLNLWAAENNFSLLSPSYCYDPTYPQLLQLQELIRAVDKGSRN
jgi:hypothetical protein